MEVSFETQLNRAWIYDKNGDEPVGETNFVIHTEYLNKVFKKLFSDKYKNLNDFLDVYEPETEGELIYQRAKADGEIIEEGVNMYEC